MSSWNKRCEIHTEPTAIEGVGEIMHANKLATGY